MIQHIIKKLLLVQTIVAFIFMLGCCLISDTDADCETPPTFVNAHVEWNLSRPTAVGSTVVYSCNDGYEMFGPADHIVLSCNQEEEWTGPDIDCTEKISCPLPPFPAFGSYSLTEAGLVFQSSVSFHCQAGYTLDGPENAICTASGKWNKVESEEQYVEPTCKRLCTQDNYRYQYHECYEPIDSTGDWNSAKTSCSNGGGQLATIKDSARQSFIANILSSDTTNIYWIGGYELDRDWKYPSDGQYATYFNWAPSEPSTPDERCVYLSNVNGAANSLKWNDEYCYKSSIDGYKDTSVPIYCICETDGNCSSLSTTYNKYQYKDRCLSFLNDTTRNQDSSKIKCSDDLGLRGKLVEIKSQDMQGFIENVINSNRYETANWWIGLEEGDDRTWSWVDGERIESFFWADDEPNNDHEKCLDILTFKDHKWNDDTCSYHNRYICQHGETKCGNPGKPFHGNMMPVKESYSVGDTVYFSCNDGYVISYRLMEGMTCQNDSTWNGTVPSCQKITCSDQVPTIPNTTSTPVSTVYRGILVYKCLDGNYALSGYPVSVCQEDATWSTPNFTCTEILTTQKYSTAPPTTTYIDTTFISTRHVPSTENTKRGQTTQLTETIQSSLSPSFQRTDVLDQTETIQPTTGVDRLTTLEYLKTDIEATDKTTLRPRLTSEIDETETTTLGRFIQSTQESFPLLTDKDVIITNLFKTATKLETSKLSDPSLTGNFIISTQAFRTSVMISDESVVTSYTKEQQHISTEGADISKSIVTTDISSDSTHTSDSLITTTSSPFSGITDISPAGETTLLQSTETLRSAVGTNTNGLVRSTTQTFNTNDPQTSHVTRSESVHTNSLSSSSSTITPSQDNLPTVTFTSSDSSTEFLTNFSDIRPTYISNPGETTLLQSTEMLHSSVGGNTNGLERSTTQTSYTNDPQNSDVTRSESVQTNSMSSSSSTITPSQDNLPTVASTSSDSTTELLTYFSGITPTDISPLGETTLVQSTEMLRSSVGTNTNGLERSTTTSNTNDPKTSDVTRSESVQTNSLSSSGSAITPSQDNLPTVTFTSSDSSTEFLTNFSDIRPTYISNPGETSLLQSTETFRSSVGTKTNSLERSTQTFNTNDPKTSDVTRSESVHTNSLSSSSSTITPSQDNLPTVASTSSDSSTELLTYFSSITPTDISPPGETTLVQSTETLRSSVGTNTNGLERSTTQTSNTNDPKTSDVTRSDSVHTNSLSSSSSTITPSQDNLSTVTFTSSDSSTAFLTRQQGSTPSLTYDIDSTTTSSFKTTRNSVSTTYYRSHESTQGTKWTNGKLSTYLTSRFHSTLYTDSTLPRTTDATNFISKLLFTNQLTTFTAGESPEDKTASRTTSLKIPSSTTDFSFVKSTTERSGTQNIITDIYSRWPFHSTALPPTTPRRTQVPSSSAYISQNPTSEPRRSTTPTESYSKGPETTHQPSNKSLIIGFSVTSAVIGIGICTWLMMFVVFKKYPRLTGKRNKVNPAVPDLNFVKDTNTENAQDKTRKEESPQAYTTLQMNDIPKDAKPYLYNNNASIDYI